MLAGEKGLLFTFKLVDGIHRSSPFCFRGGCTFPLDAFLSIVDRHLPDHPERHPIDLPIDTACRVVTWRSFFAFDSASRWGS